MRKASMILGIIGGVISILAGLLIVGGGVFFRSVMPQMVEAGGYSESYDDELYDDYTDKITEAQEVGNIAGIIYIVWGSVIMLAGVLGLTGAILVKKNNVLAGVLMLVGCAMALFTFWGFLGFILMLLGGIFALVKDSSVPQTANAPNMPSDAYERL